MKTHKRTERSLPEREKPAIKATERRDFIRAMAGLPIAGAIASFRGKFNLESFEEKNLIDSGANVEKYQAASTRAPKGMIPHAKIKDFEVSRMIMGGNLMGGWAHSRDLMYVSDLVKKYHTQDKIFETFQLAESCGINAIITNPALLPTLQTYWKQGGKIRFISDGGTDWPDTIQQSIDNGASAVYLHGFKADELASQNKLDEMAKALDRIRQSGLPAGIAGHELATIKKSVEYGLKPDFWMKTLHKTSYWSARIDHEQKNMLDPGFADNIFCPDPEETTAYMATLEQPWIAYKIMAAGAIKPVDAFRWAFEQGADFICVGMFDFQMIDDVNLAYDILKGTIQRSRPWRA